MPISHEHNLILVHVPKNAGTSVQEAFGMGDMQGHHTPEDYMRRVPEKWKNYTTFGITRNPYDRAVSSYEYALQEKSYWHDAENPDQAVHGKHPDYDKLKGKPFEYAINHIGELDHHGWHKQVRYLCSGDEVAVDWLIKMEWLDKEIEAMCQDIGIECPDIPVVNKSGDEDWKSYYENCPDCADAIYNYYKEDFETFNYSSTLTR